MSIFVEAWQEKLREDLKGFADRKSPVDVDHDGTTVSAAWTVRGAKRDELFGLAPDGSLHWITGQDGASYLDFLGSESMADMNQLAAAIVRGIDSRDNFVASNAVVEGAGEPLDIEATPEELSRLVNSSRSAADGRTALYFLKGAPGAGKTTLLREATRRQAERYLRGESEYLLFYVSAQGRELSNLRDAFSGELDDLRAAFTRDAISALVRAGLLVPVVDGFDELLGTAGYSGAFSSLQTLLNELGGQGSLVVSARSAFYDAEFIDRSTGSGSGAEFAVSAVDLKQWTDDQLMAYLNSASESVGEVEMGEALANLSAHDRQLLTRPFFASQFLEFVDELRGGGNLLDHLIRAYLSREAHKIVDSSGDPVLEADGHHRLFELVAGEMWQSESRQINVEDLRALTELVAEEFGLSSDQATQLSTKITSYAGFQSQGEARDEFAFEHEVYFDYFLSRSIQRMLLDGQFDDLYLAMDSGVVPDVVARSAVSAFSKDDGVPPPLLRVTGGLSKENRRRNLGSLVLAYAAQIAPIENVTVRGLAFIDADAQEARFSNVAFEDCQFVGVNLEKASFTKCDGATSVFQAISVSNSSELDIAGLRPGKNVGSVLHDNENVGDVYEPTVVSTILNRLGAPAISKDSTDQTPQFSQRADVLIKLLHRLAKAYRRTNIVFEGDEHLNQVFSSDYWPDLKRLLVESEVVTEEHRSASGSNHRAYRLRVQVEELLSGRSIGFDGDSRVKKFWSRLEEIV